MRNRNLIISVDIYRKIKAELTAPQKFYSNCEGSGKKKERKKPKNKEGGERKRERRGQRNELTFYVIEEMQTMASKQLFENNRDGLQNGYVKPLQLIALGWLGLWLGLCLASVKCSCIEKRKQKANPKKSDCMSQRQHITALELAVHGNQTNSLLLHSQATH